MGSLLGSVRLLGTIDHRTFSAVNSIYRVLELKTGLIKTSRRPFIAI